MSAIINTIASNVMLKIGNGLIDYLGGIADKKYIAITILKENFTMIKECFMTTGVDVLMVCEGETAYEIVFRAPVSKSLIQCRVLNSTIVSCFVNSKFSVIIPRKVTVTDSNYEYYARTRFCRQNIKFPMHVVENVWDI